MPGDGMEAGRVRWFAIVLLIAFFVPLGMAFSESGASAEKHYLKGQLLVAQPEMRDPRFRETVIFMVKHDDSGAFGLIVNRPLGEIDYATILENLGTDAKGIEGTVAIFLGGPVDPNRGFILYTNDYPEPALLPVDDRYSVTMSPDIVRALANGTGPRHSILAIGYAGWGAGQLEQELERKDWVVAPSDEKILFDTDFDTKWKRAYESRFIDI